MSETNQKMHEGEIDIDTDLVRRLLVAQFPQWTDLPLERFESSKGWTAGVDASVAVATIGANGQIDVKTLQQPVIGFVLTNVGLMANLTLEGARFIKTEA